ncbi:28 kDa ribonucleoprotein [Thalictrum thalictroides]|uniref:28 kDa ribonucleoprotein n=1 Tax=Thalictrum thalictroides TaxID=46969 RepID=A0A7J6V2X6_THATH|nr:28 kDa ribonucleoprotein [Thalictrum thalictroides]
MVSRLVIDLPQELDDYIRESINYSLCLPVSTKALESKLQASEEARKQLRDQYFFLHSRLKEKDEAIERARSEASMNAQALRKFVEENQRLAQECSNLLIQCSKWEKEVSLYEHDRSALMEFADEADDRAKEAESRLLEAEDHLRKLSEELEFYKNECEAHMGNESRLTEELHLVRERLSVLENLRMQGCSDSHIDCSQCSSPMTENHGQYPHMLNSSPEALSPVGATLEEHLLDSVMTSMVDKDGVAANAHAFLEANSGVESCQMLLKIWDRLRPSTQNVIALVGKVNTLQNDKEHLRINLTRAEEEVKVLFEENTILEEGNKKLLRLHSRERHHHGSGGKHSNSASAKNNKRKSSPRVCCSIQGMMDFDSPDSSRQPLSPLQHNSPNSRMLKK